MFLFFVLDYWFRSQTKLWNFFSDPNPSTRNLYLNIGFVSISLNEQQTQQMSSHSVVMSDMVRGLWSKLWANAQMRRAKLILKQFFWKLFAMDRISGGCLARALDFTNLPRDHSWATRKASGFVMILLQRWNQAERTNTKIQQYRLGSSLPTHISEADPVTLWNRLLSPQVIAGIKIIKTLRRWF